MKSIIAVLLVAAFATGFNDIATVNDIKRKAKEAYNNGDYETALSYYELLADSIQIDDENIDLNLANAYYKLQDTTKAVNRYSSLSSSNNKLISSVAHQQLGIIKNRKKQFKEALSHFKESLKADPSNEDSRYNYELLKKVLEEQEKQNQDQQQNQDQNKENENKEEEEKQDQQNKDQQQQNDQNKEDQEQNQENKDGDKNEEQEKEGEKKEEEQEGEKSEEEKQQEENAEEQQGEENEDQNQKGQPQSFEDKLKEMKISEEKARMILEAMKNNEIQYFQNKKRKPTKKKDKSKPDW